MLTGIQPHKLAVLIIIFMLFPVLMLFLVPAIHIVTSPESISYALMDKSSLHINLHTVNPGIHTLAADSGNGLVIRVQVGNNSGAAVSGAGVKLEASGFTGSFQPSEGFTDDTGSFISVYTPPAYIKAGTGNYGLNDTKSGNHTLSNTDSANTLTSNTEPGDSSLASNSNTLKITSRLSGTDKYSSLQVRLIPTPVVFIHGYKASPDLFSGISEYLKVQGFKPMSFSYASENGVASAASELSNYLHVKATELEDSGIQINRFDLVTHSMGGLVARYYTCSSEYTARSDVRKLIFISVPQKGSPLASLGLQYYEDKGISDLVPYSGLYTSVFPSSINAGLNPSIQTGSLLASFDEVVGTESASLAEWKIETEIFDVGESNFTVDKLLTGEILQAVNHKLILYNKMVYQRIQQMLECDIPYPATK